MNYKIINNDCLIVLDELEEVSIDSIVTDPPYELNFMGKGWDNSGIAFQKETWKKCLRVLKPGGYLLAFGGSRTYHRIACAIEDSGFEIRDTIMWLYGSGFPKSQNISKILDKKFGKERPIIGYTNNAGIAKNAKPDSTGSHIWSGNIRSDEPITDLAKQWNGWGTCLKPSFEPIIVARKPFKGSLVDNVIENGVGGINIDECRVGTEVITQLQKDMTVYHGNNLGAGSNTKMTGITTQTIGRFPANTILTYDETDFDEVCGGFPNTKGGSPINFDNVKKKNIYGGSSLLESKTKGVGLYKGFNDSGSASRYFYCAKASKKDRDEGLEEFEQETVNDGRYTPIDNPFQRGETPRKNIHPTVKPTELMQYLIRLVTPKGGTILDPFMGSGSTGKAVMFENKERNAEYKFIGIEKEKEYSEIAEARIKFASEYKEEKEDVNQISFTDFIKGE